MLLTVFEKYIFLQSLGWGIANSLWQAALLFMIYQLVAKTGKQLPAIFRYHFSMMLVFASFAWFVSTVLQNYIALRSAGTSMAALNWLAISDNFSQSLQWLSVAYCLVLGVHLLLFVKKLKGLFTLKNSDLIKAPVDIRIFTGQTSLHIGIQKKVSIWLSEKAGVPSVIGFFKPVILMPVSALANLTTAQVEAVILHELAHIRRNDYLINFLQCCIEMILFFNPFVRMMGAIARKERENCCDDWVLNYRYSRQDYAAALLVLEQNRFASIQFALAATNGKKDLLQRVKRLFADEPSVQFNFSQKVKLLAITGTIFTAILVALPVADKKTMVAAGKTKSIVLPASSPLAVSEKINIPQVIIVDDNKPAMPPVADRRYAAAKKPPAAAGADVPEETEYQTALVNEELLHQNEQQQLAEMAIQASHSEATAPNKILVKIEEEQSGVKDKNIYYMEVSNNNGTAEIKPLVVLNKKVKGTTAKGKVKTNAAKPLVGRKKATT